MIIVLILYEYLKERKFLLTSKFISFQSDGNLVDHLSRSAFEKSKVSPDHGIAVLCGKF
jgi:hypothetical protein